MSRLVRLWIRSYSCRKRPHGATSPESNHWGSASRTSSPSGDRRFDSEEEILDSPGVLKGFCCFCRIERSLMGLRQHDVSRSPPKQKGWSPVWHKTTAAGLAKHSRTARGRKRLWHRSEPQRPHGCSQSNHDSFSAECCLSAKAWRRISHPPPRLS